ncbi:MAG TPA: glycerol-3-phosphate 1-O-acyltransferase PlsY [Burkholderiales bacterium]|nr:glycerol-3-phosphate 1-O-acyltransferase PlsY [Burkholderiales bacterium]
MAAAVFILLAYLVGSLSFAVIVSRAFGLPDPHTYGSGNPGATNVLRTGRKLAALLTLVGDAGKGWLAVYLAERYAADYGVDATGIAACAVAVFLGHLFPVFFGFRGGKGVSTALGILLAVQPWLGLATLATWIVIAVFFRYASLASLVAAVFAPLYAFFMSLLGFDLGVMLPAVILMAALLVWRHKSNILNLGAGRERRIGEKQDSGSRIQDPGKP